MKLYALLVCLAVSFSMYSQPPEWDPNKTITDSDQINFTVMRDGVYDDHLFLGITFEDGLNIRSQKNVYFYGCTFRNKGVKLSYDTDGTKADSLYIGNSNITFDSCAFENVTENGIVTSIKDSPFVDHNKLVIKNNTFDGWGLHTLEKLCPRGPDTSKPPTSQSNCERCGDSYNKFDHAIYMRATDSKIENNVFYHTVGGPAISVRNSATITGNKIYSDTFGVGSALNYWDQYNARGSKKLTILNNVFIETAQDSTLVQDDIIEECTNSVRDLVGFHDKNADIKSVEKIVFAFNTLVVLPGKELPNYYALLIRNNNDDFEDINIYGNLILDQRDSPLFYHYKPDISYIDIDVQKNLLTTDDDIFINCDWNVPPYDTRLRNLKFRPNLDVADNIPILDIYGNLRSVLPLNVGAHQYASPSLDVDGIITTDSNIEWQGKTNISASTVNNSNLTVMATDYGNLLSGFSVESGSSFKLKLGCKEITNTTGRQSTVKTGNQFNQPTTSKISTSAIYPNPATDVITFDKAIESAEIYDQTGKLKIHKNDPLFSTLEISDLNPGIYYIRIKASNKSTVLRLIKK